MEKLQPLWGNRPPPQVKPHFRCCHFLPSCSWCTLRAPILPTTSCWRLLSTNFVKIMLTTCPENQSLLWLQRGLHFSTCLQTVPALIFLNVDMSMLNVPCPISMSSCKKWKQGSFYGKNESTNVAACWKNTPVRHLQLVGYADVVVGRDWLQLRQKRL